MEFASAHRLPDLTTLDTVVLPIWSDEANLLHRFPDLGNGLLSSLWQGGKIKVNRGETNTVYSTVPWPKVIILGLGDKAEFSLEQARLCGAALVKTLAQTAANQVLIVAEAVWPQKSEGQFLGALVEGMILGNYRFERYLSTQTYPQQPSTITVFHPSECKEIVQKAILLAQAVNQARDLVNEPANALTPNELARRSIELGEATNLQCQTLEVAELTKLGMGGLLGVAKGSVESPKLIILRYNGKQQAKNLAFVGKGITFDAGGISLKPARGMQAMKSDMAGGAAVIAALTAIAALRIPINVVGIIPAAENMPSGSALKPGDIVRMYNGTTVEIGNTDAEGRLILADALAYALTLGVDYLLDVATLSSACSIALGPIYSGLWSNNDDLQTLVLQAARAAGEKFWPMPLDQEFLAAVRGYWADLRNSVGAEGNANNAAAFLSQFVGTTPWVHLDIAPTGYSDYEAGYIKRGGTGVAVRTLVHVAYLLAE